jgi:regulator of sigma E protease
MCAWRRGIGWRRGSTHEEYLKRAEAFLDEKHKELPGRDMIEYAKEKVEYTEQQIGEAAKALGMGETEYRLNWIPLGGYVKMVGQDDLKANAGVDDPRAFNRKSVGARMIVVSAGVIMNIILAAIGFMVIFLLGFDAPAAIAGGVLTGSPAQKAGVHVGDRIVSLDGTRQYDFNRISLTTALLKDDRDVPMVVQRSAADGSTRDITMQIRPARMENDPKGFLAIGLEKTQQLQGIPLEEARWLDKSGPAVADFDIIQPGDVITKIAGKDVVNVKYGFPQLDDALQHSDGLPVPIQVRTADGKLQDRTVPTRLATPFSGKLAIAGMEPRPAIESMTTNSSALNRLQPGDVIQAITIRDLDRYPDVERVHKLTGDAAAEGRNLSVQVMRSGKSITVADLPTKSLGNGQHGLGIAVGYDEAPVVSQVVEDSPAKRAGIPAGAKILTVDGQPVQNWFQVTRLLGTVGQHAITAEGTNLSANAPTSAPISYSLQMDGADVESLHQSVQATCLLTLQELDEPRKTSNPLVAMSWGLVETRDFILEFYVTIARMFQGRISYTNMMGPVGIAVSGAKFASKGFAWLIWFLCMISANLAVVNFLPIPIVDGGLFTFLILEKIKGKPLSPKFQAVAQVVGFAIICGVFLLVTFQDIKRYLGF